MVVGILDFSPQSRFCFGKVVDLFDKILKQNNGYIPVYIKCLTLDYYDNMVYMPRKDLSIKLFKHDNVSAISIVSIARAVILLNGAHGITVYVIRSP